MVNIVLPLAVSGFYLVISHFPGAERINRMVLVIQAPNFRSHKIPELAGYGLEDFVTLDLIYRQE